MKTLNELNVVALEVAEMQVVQGGDSGQYGVWGGPDGGCIPMPGRPRPNPTDPLVTVFGQSWAV